VTDILSLEWRFKIDRNRAIFVCIRGVTRIFEYAKS